MAGKAPKTDDNTEDEGKKSGMMGFVIMGVAAMAGSFGVSYMNKPDVQLDMAACSPEDGAHAEAPPLIDKDLVYVDLPDILTTIGSEPATRYLKMNVTVATNKPGESSVIESKLVIMDAFISYLRSVELSDFEDPGFYGHMREQLAHRSEIILGASAAEGVLITEFLLR
ncbi:MAG: flagellar basal body-associated FliL family protein [Hyphomonadaceae bacterium]